MWESAELSENHDWMNWRLTQCNIVYLQSPFCHGCSWPLFISFALKKGLLSKICFWSEFSTKLQIFRQLQLGKLLSMQLIVGQTFTLLFVPNTAYHSAITSPLCFHTKFEVCSTISLSCRVVLYKPMFQNHFFKRVENIKFQFCIFDTTNI